MRKIVYCFPFLLCLAFSSCGNKNYETEQQIDLWKNGYFYDGKGLMKAITNTYDENGLITNQIMWNISKNKERFTKTYYKYEYNQAKLMTASRSFEIDPVYGEINTEFYLIDYDSHNNIVKEITIVDSVVDKIINYSYVYDKNDNIVEETVEFFREHGYTLDRKVRYFYSYDNSNRLVGSTEYVWYSDFDDPSKADIDDVKITYDQKKIITLEIKKDHDSSDAAKTITIIEKNDKQQVTSSVVYFYEVTGETEVLKKTSETYNDYNEYGRIQREINYTTSIESEFAIRNERISVYTYCGRNHDKTLTIMEVNFNIDAAGRVTNADTFNMQTNYYDDRERLIKHELVGGSASNGKNVRINTSIYEY